MTKVVCKLSDVPGRMIANEQRLEIGLGTAQAKAMNRLRPEMNFATNQAVFPERVHGEGVGQESDASLVIRASNKNGLGIGASRKAFRRPEQAWGGGLLSLLGFEVMGGHEAIGTAAQLGAMRMMKAFPDFGLPEVVEGFDLVLEAMLPGRSKDGRDTQGQAEKGDGAKTVGMVMGAMKTEVVVELGIDRQTVSAPMGEQGVLGELGRDGDVQKTAAKAAVQGDGVEDLDFADALDDESLDDVKGVQLGSGRSDVWEMPTRRGRRAAEATGTADQAVSLEDVGDGSAAGQGVSHGAFRAQSAEDGDRPVLAPNVVLAESVAQGQNALDHFGSQGVRWVSGGVRMILKVDAIEAARAGSFDPVLNVRKGEVEPASNLPQANAAAGEQYDLPPVSERQFFMRCRLGGAARAVSFVPAPLRSASTTLTARYSSFIIDNHSF